MSEFQLSSEVDNEKVFLTKLSEIEGRLDPFFNYHLKNSQIKSSFEQEQLYKISKPFSGGTPSKDKPEYWSGNIPWVSPKDFKGLYLAKSVDSISKQGLDNSSTKLVPKNSVIIVVRSGVLIHSLPVTINTIPVTINQDLKAFVIKDNRILPEYFGMYFYVFGRKLLPLITKHSTTVQSINTDQFAKLKLPIPPIEIQKEVIKLINQSIQLNQEKRAEAKQLLASIDDYLLKELGITLPEKDNSLENRIFTTNLSEVSGGRFDPKLYDNNTRGIRNAIDETTFDKPLLKELIIHSVAGDWGKDEKDDLGDKYKKCLVIRATEFDNLYNLKLDNSRVKYRLISKEKLDRIDIQENDLLIEKSGGSPDQPVGRISILTDEILNNNTIGYSNFIHKIRVDNSKIKPEYLFCYLKTIHNIKLTDAMQSQTNGIRNLIMSNYFNQTIPLPKIEKQTEIANHISEIRAKAKQLEQEAKEVLNKAKQEVEQIILGEQ